MMIETKKILMGDLRNPDGMYPKKCIKLKTN